VAVREREEPGERVRRQDPAADPAVERLWQQRVADVEVTDTPPAAVIPLGFI